MLGPWYNHERSVEYSFSERVYLVLQALVPVLLTAVIISLVIFRVDVTESFHKTAAEVKIEAAHVAHAAKIDAEHTACHAVLESDQDLQRFLRREFHRLGQHDPKTQRFLSDLRRAQASTFRQCEARIKP
jgi:hypothetical protein